MIPSRSLCVSSCRRSTFTIWCQCRQNDEVLFLRRWQVSSLHIWVFIPTPIVKLPNVRVLRGASRLTSKEIDVGKSLPESDSAPPDQPTLGQFLTDLGPGSGKPDGGHR